MRHEGKNEAESGGKIKSWTIIFLIIAFILIYGSIVFLTVGDKGPPEWGFGALPDVPGESPYSTEPVK